MEEASVHQQLPNHWVAPVVRRLLRVYSYPVVIVSSLEYLRHCEFLVEGDANEVFPEFFVAVLKRHLVIDPLAHRIADDAVSIPNEQ